MSILHADFAEQFAPLDKAAFVGVTTEQNTGYVLVAGYQRLAVLIHALTVGTTLDADVEIATAVGGTDALTLKSMTQLGAADDDKLICIDIRPDELTAPAGTSATDFDYLNVEVTPSGAATVSVIVLGIPRDQPASGWDAVVS
ncbi:MAG: hypothetical protein L6Q98_24160 [Anaerolineae bacterium]|nr:hypothetical protein [Anaerolineae bacterium]NUQ07013.1 hypothetical protein [Anaerolineae bacterium]